MAIGVGLGIATRPQASARARRRLRGLRLGCLGGLGDIAARIVFISALIGSIFAHLAPRRTVAIAIAALATVIVLIVLIDLIAGGFVLRVIGADIVTKILVVLDVVALAPIFLEARAAFVEYAEIMVRELEIIFRHDPVTLGLCVARKILVLLMKLRRVATCTVIYAIALIGPTLAGLWPLAAAAAPAAGLTIVHQAVCVLD